MAEVKTRGKVTVAAMDDKTTKRDKEDKKKQNDLRHSNYWITINTNKRFTGYEEDYQEFVDKFRAVIEEIFDKDLKRYVKINKPDHAYNTQYFKDVSSEAVIEKGGKNNTIHAHIMVKFAHRTSITLDYGDIRNKVMNEMGLDSLFMSNKLFRRADDNLERYLYKDVAEQPAELEPVVV